jgi:hypothetical protein
MTRILMILALSNFSSFIVNAQFKKNDILLGGQLSYSYNSNSYTQTNVSFPPTNDSKNNNGNITISIGKALNENTLIGINLTYQPSSYTNYPNINGNIPLKYVSNGYNVGLFYRKYKNLGKDFYYFGDISAGYYWSNQSGKDSIGEKLLSGSSWSVGINLSPGIAYRISKHFFMELIMPNLFYAGYYKYSLENQYGTATEVQTNKNDQLTISTSLSSNPLTSLGIGFRLIL